MDLLGKTSYGNTFVPSQISEAERNPLSVQDILEHIEHPICSRDPKDSLELNNLSTRELMEG